MTIATALEFRARVPERTLAGISDAFILSFLDEAESEVATIIGPRGYAVPMTFVSGIAPADLKGHVIRMALWKLMVARGFSQNSDTDDPLRLGYEDALAYLRRVASGEYNINAAMISTARTATRVAMVFSSVVDMGQPNRGWGDGSST